jgi:DNA repair protein RadC
MQSKNYPINKWALDDRPREKLLSKSPMALSDAELLAILINSGNTEMSAVELGREVMKLCNNNLNDLFKLTVNELRTIRGIGRARAITIVAALELGRRRHAAELKKNFKVTASHDVAKHLRTLLRDLNAEVFAVLYLNKANKIIYFGIISQGGITGTIVDPRLIIRKALEEDALNLILCHNHPSGSLLPSQADKAITQKVKEAARLFDITVIDHIIVSEEGYYSFADEGIL